MLSTHVSLFSLHNSPAGMQATHTMQRGAWRAAVHGVPQSRTRLSDSYFHFLTRCWWVALELGSIFSGLITWVGLVGPGEWHGETPDCEASAGS